MRGVWGEELHALDYLTYAYLQLARDDAADGVLAQLKAIPASAQRNFKSAYAFAAIPARCSAISCSSWGGPGKRSWSASFRSARRLDDSTASPERLRRRGNRRPRRRPTASHENWLNSVAPKAVRVPSSGRQRSSSPVAERGPRSGLVPVPVRPGQGGHRQGAEGGLQAHRRSGRQDRAAHHGPGAVLPAGVCPDGGEVGIGATANQPLGKPGGLIRGQTASRTAARSAGNRCESGFPTLARGRTPTTTGAALT